MIAIKGFTPRRYQANILKTCKNNNTLVCLPTGTGKTKVAILLAVEQLNKLPGSKVVVCSPTKPLTNQIKEEFREATTLEPTTVNILTGSITPSERRTIWNRSTVVVATPQTIENDLAKKRVSLENVSLLCIDECHRSKMRYANTAVAKAYFEQAKDQRVIALTASPGSTKESLKEICDNLQINAVEIRSEDDEDIQEYIQGKEIRFVKVELPKAFKDIKELIKKLYYKKLETVKKFGLTKPVKIINKRDLLMMQARLQQQIRQRNRAAFIGVSIVAQALKLSYLLELVETQTINGAKKYLEKLQKEKTKAAATINKAQEIEEATKKINALYQKKTKHPKLEKIKEFINGEMNKNRESKIIVFANFRNTVDEIVQLLKENNIKAKKFVGQANKESKGLKQKEQIKLLNEFKESIFNVLVASSVGEEGLDIPEVQAVIFYEPVASELRRVQRSGRTGRTKPGKVIYLITKGTRDEAYHWASHNKQKKMKDMLYKIKEKQERLAKI